MKVTYRLGAIECITQQQVEKRTTIHFQSHVFRMSTKYESNFQLSTCK